MSNDPSNSTDVSSPQWGIERFLLVSLVGFPISFYLVQVVVTLVGLTSVNNIKSEAPTHLMVGAGCGIIAGYFILQAKTVLSTVRIAWLTTIICMGIFVLVLFTVSAANGSVRRADLPLIYLELFIEYTASGILSGLAAAFLLHCHSNMRSHA